MTWPKYKNVGKWTKQIFRNKIYSYSKKMIFQLLVKLDTLISMSFSEIEISEFFSAILVYFTRIFWHFYPYFRHFTHDSNFRHFFFLETKKSRILKKFSGIFTCNQITQFGFESFFQLCFWPLRIICWPISESKILFVTVKLRRSFHSIQSHRIDSNKFMSKLKISF